MGRRSQLGVALAWGLLSSVATFSFAQSYTPPPPPLTTLPPCPLAKNGKPDKKQKHCDPTIYPSEKLETKGVTKGKSADSPAESQSAPTTSPQTPAAQQFPFPGEQTPKGSGSPTAQAFPYPGSDAAAGGKSSNGSASEAPTQDQSGNISGHTDVPHDPSAETKAAGTSAGKAFPYPGDTAAGIPSNPDVPTGEKRPDGESSSSSSSSSSSGGGDADAGSASDAAPGPKGQYDEDDSAPMPRVKDKKAKPVARAQTEDERVDEDLSVAKFYGQNGNKMGAYLRAKDAVKTEPDYAEGHFVLGQAAERLGKKDEAAAEFSHYLKLAPDGARAKAAEKALADLR